MWVTTLAVTGIIITTGTIAIMDVGDQADTNPGTMVTAAMGATLMLTIIVDAVITGVVQTAGTVIQTVIVAIQTDMQMPAAGLIQASETTTSTVTVHSVQELSIVAKNSGVQLTTATVIAYRPTSQTQVVHGN